jgi:hypothetical protein
MLTFDKIIEKLQEIKKLGYIQTHRSGDTGIGKTLEDLLGIEENNFPSSNGHLIELKSGRKNVKTMLTLFTKSPLPDKSNTALLQKFGYPSRRGNNRKELHTTVHATSFYNLKGKPTFKIEIQQDKIELIDSQRNVLGYWTKELLKESFERKLPEILYVKADSKGKGKDESFWYNEAWLLRGLDFENFLRLLSEDSILVDIRIGQYPNGKTHDHGTGFRVLPAKLDLCFKERKQVI